MDWQSVKTLIRFSFWFGFALFTQARMSVQIFRIITVQWTLITTTAFVPKDIAIKMNLLLYRILNEQIDM